MAATPQTPNLVDSLTELEDYQPTVRCLPLHLGHIR